MNGGFFICKENSCLRVRSKVYTAIMSQELNIQKVAHVTGLSVHTLRYYEKIGLLDLVVRTSSGYRHYTEADLSWIEFLKRLRETGMPIATMQKFAELRRKGTTASRPYWRGSQCRNHGKRN